MAGVAIGVGRSSCTSSSTALWHKAWSQLWSTIAAITCLAIRLLLQEFVLRLGLGLGVLGLVHAADASDWKLALHVGQQAC